MAVAPFRATIRQGDQQDDRDRIRVTIYAQVEDNVAAYVAGVLAFDEDDALAFVGIINRQVGPSIVSEETTDPFDDLTDIYLGHLA